MERIEDIIQNPELAQAHRVDAEAFFQGWEDTEYTPNARETGTSCLRYLVRQPDYHRDVDHLESGGYKFSAFGLRRSIGGNFNAKRHREGFGGLDVYAYAPDLDAPYETDLFGVSVPGVFNFELLDHYQQKLSLVGVAHLHMHAPDMEGAGILSFNEDGRLRYAEMRLGESKNHDLVQVFEDRIVAKIGGDFAAVRQTSNTEHFGVPLWSFVEDTSLWIETSQDLEEPHLINCTPIDQNRQGFPETREHFNLRQVARTLYIPGSQGTSGSYKLDSDVAVESSVAGNTEVTVEWNSGEVEILLSSLDEPGEIVRYEVGPSLHRNLTEELPQTSLAIDSRSVPKVGDVVDFSKAAYLAGHRVLAGRTPGSHLQATGASFSH